MSIDRRRFVSSAVLSGVGTTLSGSNAACGAVLALPAPAIREAADGFRFCLNTSTIREPKLGIQKEVEIAGAAGYDGIEPWIPTLREFVSGGGKLSDLSKQIAETGSVKSPRLPIAAQRPSDRRFPRGLENVQ